MKKNILLGFIIIAFSFLFIGNVKGDEKNFLRCNYTGDGVVASAVFNLGSDAYYEVGENISKLGGKDTTYVITNGKRNAENIQNSDEIEKWVKENKTCPTNALVVVTGSGPTFGLTNTVYLYLKNNGNFENELTKACGKLLTANKDKCLESGGHVLKWDNVKNYSSSVYETTSDAETTQSSDLLEQLRSEYKSLGCKGMEESNANYEKCQEILADYKAEKKRISESNISNDMKFILEAHRKQQSSSQIEKEIIITDSCGLLDEDTAAWFHEVLWFLAIAGVILVIVLGAMDFIKGIVGDADKIGPAKPFKNFMKRLIALAILLLLPVIIEFILTQVDITGVNEDSIFCGVTDN